MRLILILLLSTLASCSSLPGTQAVGLAYNLPGYKDELQNDHKRNIECLKAKQCVSYWDSEAGIYVVHRYTPEELKGR